jgi:hypothetical protein
MAGKFNMADFLVLKPLDEMCYLCYALNAVLLKKKLLRVLKFQNGGWIQDGVESGFIFHPLFSIMNICQIFFLEIQNGG